MKTSTTGFNPNYEEDSPTIEEAEQAEGFYFLEFGAPWCQHCQASAPVIKKALAELNLPHIKVFDGKGKPLGRSFNVKLWPTLILLQSGKELARVVRPLDDEAINQLTSLIK